MLFNFRFDELFRTKEKWSLEKISPYIRYVITEAGFNLNFVFNFPFCNCFCVKNSIKLSSFLLFQIWIVWWMFEKIRLSTIFYLYFMVDCKSNGEMLRTLEKITDLWKVFDKLDHMKLYQEHLHMDGYHVLKHGDMHWVHVYTIDKNLTAKITPCYF